MSEELTIGKYSLGVGDRFARQAAAQLRACLKAAQQGVEVIPVWNKSNREHLIIGSEPGSTRSAADAAVKALGWKGAYYVDADHIGLKTVDRFVPHADFYTIDVANWIGKPAEKEAIAAFARRHGELAGRVEIPGLERQLELGPADLERVAGKYLLAAQEAGRVYQHVVGLKGEGKFITEVSMDETDSAQTPAELLVILAALADEGIPVQTIAPKFTGRFNKGVDYVGEAGQFEQEFAEDVAVAAFAANSYGLPGTLKLSVHSGSDKFSLYGPIRRVLGRFQAGVHVKTAGTTWLEEVIGLAEAGGKGLALAKEIYTGALEHVRELCAPYATVIDIDEAKLPTARAVAGWSGEQFVGALRHEPKNPAFNPHLRQLLHVGYKMAAQMGARYLEALGECEAHVSRNVTENLYARHLKPLFLDSD
ncbi:MAG TPA: tagaturonate epimerase family protein [Candidatus Paceibacterota bacterium]|nr:tagaturonate epimerase family protein [Verrucomicrobiota bacterium]HSA12288.1 tagaturonate epimerase family protein [Candidatus Paceibacterota bacterium]